MVIASSGPVAGGGGVVVAEASLPAATIQSLFVQEAANGTGGAWGAMCTVTLEGASGAAHVTTLASAPMHFTSVLPCDYSLGPLTLVGTSPREALVTFGSASDARVSSDVEALHMVAALLGTPRCLARVLELAPVATGTVLTLPVTAGVQLCTQASGGLACPGSPVALSAQVVAGGGVAGPLTLTVELTVDVAAMGSGTLPATTSLFMQATVVPAPGAGLPASLSCATPLTTPIVTFGTLPSIGAVVQCARRGTLNVGEAALAECTSPSSLPGNTCSSSSVVAVNGVVPEEYSLAVVLTGVSNVDVSRTASMVTDSLLFSGTLLDAASGAVLAVAVSAGLPLLRFPVSVSQVRPACIVALLDCGCFNFVG
jgi:hypothetical protein